MVALISMSLASYLSGISGRRLRTKALGIRRNQATWMRSDKRKGKQAQVQMCPVLQIKGPSVRKQQSPRTKTFLKCETQIEDFMTYGVVQDFERRLDSLRLMVKIRPQKH